MKTTADAIEYADHLKSLGMNKHADCIRTLVDALLAACEDMTTGDDYEEYNDEITNAANSYIEMSDGDE